MRVMRSSAELLCPPLSIEYDSGKNGKDGSKGIGCVQPLAVDAAQTIFITGDEHARDGVGNVGGMT